MNMTTVPFAEAKTHLSKYGRMAEEGGITVVQKHRRSAFLIAPLPKCDQAHPKKLGLAAGRIHMAPDFDATPDDVIDAFEGKA